MANFTSMMSIKVLNEEFSPFVAEDIETLSDLDIMDAYVEFSSGDGYIEPYWKRKDQMHEVFAISQFVYTKDLDFCYEDN